MAQRNEDLEALGQNIQEIIDRAINSRDYQKLNQNIRQTVERAVDFGSQTVRNVKAASRNAAANARTVASGQNVQTESKKDLSLLYGKTGGMTVAGIAKIVGGGLLCCATGVGILASLVMNMMISGSATVAVGVGTWGLLAGGALLLAGGIRNVTHIGRFRKYRKLLGDKTHCTLEKLARHVGKPVKFVRREVQKMIGEGLFLEGHLDKEETMLITSDETFRYFEQSRLQLEQKQRQEEAARLARAHNPLEPGVQEVLERGEAFIAQIVKCNDAIPGQQMSEKISRMEQIVRRIFQRAQEHPEVVPDLKKMMDYYLPMTVKLLNAYAEMDGQPVQGETITSSKREIEGALDTLNQAFENLLDDLFEDTALDISSDISVLNTLLAQEGLTEDGLSRMRKKNQT